MRFLVLKTSYLVLYYSIKLCKTVYSELWKNIEIKIRMNDFSGKN